jgi:hypothetical protein
MNQPTYILCYPNITASNFIVISIFIRKISLSPLLLAPQQMQTLLLYGLEMPKPYLKGTE